MNKCQICNYAFDHAELDVPNMFISSVTVSDIENGDVKLPFTEKAGWLKIQKNDKLHREVMKLIQSGQQPEKKKNGSSFYYLEENVQSVQSWTS